MWINEIGEWQREPQDFFHEGTNYRAYEFFGAHFDGKGVWFRTWAPNARGVSVVGDFNNWDVRDGEMVLVTDAGYWKGYIPNLSQFDNYKFAILQRDGTIVMKADPFAFHAETRPGTASKIYNMDGYEWGDAAWQRYKKRYNPTERPMNIYEVHFGSWRHHEDGSFYSYRQMANTLIPYVKQMGYTHIELLPMTEFPFDGSWGYQVTGYFAATSRFGEPKDLMYFVDMCHQNGIGVIMDWVPAHFPKDEAGLYEFDGTKQYEYDDLFLSEHADWGTRIFDYGKPGVRAFLISSAMFWVDYYHMDGIRVDAVASMLYRDYGRRDGQWRPNIHGGRENLEAVSFLQELNRAVITAYPETMMIAEESTAWPMVTKPQYDGGLGFHFKWNMGWMNDMLDYFQTDPYFRKSSHEKLTFSLTYAFSENFILPLSHDEVVHGKHSLIEKQPGEYLQKFAGLRAMLGYMMMHPGKKLTFMGTEFGQFIEWDFAKQLDWFLLEYETHSNLHTYVRELNAFYLKHSSLWQVEDSWDCFRWLLADAREENILAFIRKNKRGETLVIVCNFAPVIRKEYSIPTPSAGTYMRIFCSDDALYGGSNEVQMLEWKTERAECHEYHNRMLIDIPPMSVSVYRKKIRNRMIGKSGLEEK